MRCGFRRRRTLIKATRLRLPVGGCPWWRSTQPSGDRPHGPITLLEAFEGRRQLIAYYFMWSTGRPAAEQCEGCTWFTTQVTELSHLHLAISPSRSSVGSVQREHSLPRLQWAGRCRGTPQKAYSTRSSRRRHPHDVLACYVRDSERRLRNLLDEPSAASRQWTTPTGSWTSLSTGARRRGRTRLPTGYNTSTTPNLRTNGRPVAPVSRLEAGRSDALGIAASRDRG